MGAPKTGGRGPCVSGGTGGLGGQTTTRDAEFADQGFAPRVDTLERKPGLSVTRRTVVLNKELIPCGFWTK